MIHFYFQIGDDNPRFVEFDFNPGELTIEPRKLTTSSRNAQGDMKVASIYGKHLFDISISGVWISENVANELMSLQHASENVYFCPKSLAGEIYRIEEKGTSQGGYVVLQNTSASGIHPEAIYFQRENYATGTYHPKLRQAFNRIGLLTENLIGDTYISFGKDLQLAQGFKLNQTTAIGGIAIKLGRSLYHIDEIPIIWEICATSGNDVSGVPGKVLASGIVPKPGITSLIPNYTWLGINIPSIQLNANTLYWIKFSTTALTSDSYCWQLQIGGDYGWDGWLSNLGRRVGHNFVFRVSNPVSKDIVLVYTFHKILVNVSTIRFSRQAGVEIGYSHQITMESK